MKKIATTLMMAALSLLSLNATEAIKQSDKDRAAELLSKMTLEEKCRLVSGQIDKFHTYGIPRLGIQSVLFADATMGVRALGNVSTTATCFPSAIANAASFNREACRAAGKAVALDCKARGVGVLLGPGVNMYRNSRCGRNFEYMGEDPYLAGTLAAEYIKGVQDEGVIATVKHFALNNQEYDRHMTESRADERTINEIYFPTFKKAVDAGVAAVMSSYNPVNGAHSSDNQWLLNNLRKWGFEGIIMSDWASTYTTIGCMESELDMEFPGNQCFTPERIMPLIEKGIVTEAQLDKKCLHILQTLSAFNLIDKDIKDENIPENIPENHICAQKMAEESIVMLKNNGILPLKQGKGSIVVTGPMADWLARGGGSSIVYPVAGRTVTLNDALRALGKKYNFIFNSNPSDEQIANARAVIVAVGNDRYNEKEGEDQKEYSLDKYYNNRILKDIVSKTDKAVVIVNSGTEVDPRGWSDEAAAILYAWFQGEAGGTALANIITGKISPSGRLPFTYWGSEKANPTYNYYKPVVISSCGEAPRYSLVEYGEGVFLGYRGIDKFGVQPLYPFGYGLTYSTFEYSDLETKADGSDIVVSFTLKNTGKVEAAEVAQIYVAPINPSVPRPTRELKEFAKIKLAKGESQKVTVRLPHSAFAHYDQTVHSWIVDGGKYKIQIGASATDIKLEASVTK